MMPEERKNNEKISRVHKCIARGRGNERILAWLPNSMDACPRRGGSGLSSLLFWHETQVHQYQSVVQRSSVSQRGMAYAKSLVPNYGLRLQYR